MSIIITDKFTKSTGACGRTYKHVECICECGKIFVTQVSNARRAVSCGCLNPTSSTHRMSKTSVYMVWHSMRDRCNNKRHKRYADYGGRGITICEKWNNFEKFYEDMGDNNGLSIDRIDNNKGYYKENCKWSTAKEQSLNRRNTKYLTIDDETKTVHEWSKFEKAASEQLIRRRFYRGWSHKEAVFGRNKEHI